MSVQDPTSTEATSALQFREVEGCFADQASCLHDGVLSRRPTRQFLPSEFGVGHTDAGGSQLERPEVDVQSLLCMKVHEHGNTPDETDQQACSVEAFGGDELAIGLQPHGRLEDNSRSQPPDSAEVMTLYNRVPHPFALHLGPLQQGWLAPKAPLPVYLTLVGKACRYAAYFIIAFRQAAEKGIGHRRQTFTLTTAEHMDPLGCAPARLLDIEGEDFRLPVPAEVATLAEPISIEDVGVKAAARQHASGTRPQAHRADGVLQGPTESAAPRRPGMRRPAPGLSG